jgi:predicted  nucleic acid-binding Zn-ribbon protein
MEQPQDNPNIPGNLQKEIEGVRNKISIGESEVLRLKDLVKAEKYAVGQLTNSKKALEDELAVLEEKSKEATHKLFELTKDLAIAETESGRVKGVARDVLEKLDGLEKSKQELMEVIKQV